MIIGLVNAGVVVQGPGNPPLGLTTDFTTLRMLTFAIGLALVLDPGRPEDPRAVS